MDRLAPLTLVAALLVACSSEAVDGPVRILSIADASGVVDETLELVIAADNPAGVTLDWSFEAASVPQLDRVAVLAGTPSGAVFRWTPLASQVGAHEVTFRAAFPGGAAEQVARVTVAAAASAAPVFLRPGPGGAFDLSRDPCVVFAVEVRDDDSTDVALRLGESSPEGASLDARGPKSGTVSWCPTRDQLDASRRWVLVLHADDGEHAPVRHEYIAVLQQPSKEGCPGVAPEIDIVGPEESARVQSAAGYEVVAEVRDESALRDAPLLYWAVGEGGDIDLTTANQQEFVPDDGQWRTRVPPLGLVDDAEAVIRFAVVAIDNDDPDGAACDHTTVSPTRRLIALAGTDTAVLSACEPCFASEECVGGICAVSGGAGVCVDPCARCDVECAPATTRSGGVADACLGACFDTAQCADDPDEPGDSPGTSTALDDLQSGTICRDDIDLYEVTASTDGLLTVTLAFAHADGDLDLRLLDAAGAIVASSAGTADLESVSVCVTTGDALYAEVFGYAGDSGDYLIESVLDADGCGADGCSADRFEPNQTRAGAAPIEADLFEGTLCDGDDDWFAVDSTSGDTVEALVVFDPEVVDIDVELFGPDGSIVADSRTVTGEEYVATTSVGGTYGLHVFRYDGAVAGYEAVVEVSSSGSLGGGASDPCDTRDDCAAGRACIDLPGGYCASTGCDVVPCARGEVCVLDESTWICARDCDGGEFLCRAEHSCVAEFDPVDELVFACLP